MQQGTALVTGASTGIGAELARQFAERSHDVVLVARREAKLRQAADTYAARYGVETHVVAQDLASREGRTALYDEVQERGLQIDYLVNNVGIGTQGHFLDTDLDQELTQVELNVATPTHLTKLFGRDMRERGHGGVLNVASTAAFQPGPFMAVYYASKSYALSLSEALHEEFDDDGVTVTALCPGPVETEFQERAGNDDVPIGDPDAGGLLRWQTPDEVAEAGISGLANGTAVVVPGIEYKLLSGLTKLLPRSVTRRLAADLNH
ncbi:SDR family NAD(P)-dependent oxidoreductase [Halorarius litoreus]|uniref:SDR family NAD(P)-dependent oxidoreductase n=1 Tax=Halorarius litoreus TaxID=2962676 RepID=UPI0020CE38E0|nr:SDR family oxidoreductase [Halorarius litoreus]